jgi:DNA-binding transcriptional ArsR family regulator
MRNQVVTHSAGLGRHSSSHAVGAAFQALADPTRRALLELLRRGSRPAGEMASAFPVSRPAISRHLRVLRQAHLVRESRSGRHRYYALNPEPLRAVDKWLEDYRALWSGKLAALKAFIEADEAASRSGSTQTKRRGRAAHSYRR